MNLWNATELAGRAAKPKGGLRMKKIAIVSLVLGYLALGLLPRTVAAQANVVTIDIPFAFMVQDTKFASGTYTITKVEKMNYRISNLKGDQQAMFATHTTSSPQRAASFTLVFNVYGDQYYLSKFFHQGMTSGNAIAQTAAEKDLAKKVPVTTKTVTGEKK
jgi:hypothetical protein